jgi:hypothetical protein
MMPDLISPASGTYLGPEGEFLRYEVYAWGRPRADSSGGSSIVTATNDYQVAVDRARDLVGPICRNPRAVVLDREKVQVLFVAEPDGEHFPLLPQTRGRLSPLAV